MLKVGIVGLPNAGKSTLFNALTGLSVPAERYPFCTIKPNTAIVNIPDERLDKLANLFPDAKRTYETLEFIDIAGLVEGAHKGEGLGNQFLSDIRGVDAIVHIVRLFDAPEVPHPLASLDPVRDAKIIENELVASDVEILARNIEKLRTRILRGDKSPAKELEALEKTLTLLESGNFAPETFAEEELALIRKYQILSLKPVIYVANLDEKGLDLSQNEYYINLERYAKSLSRALVSIPAKLESELKRLTPEEEAEFRQALGLSSGLERLILACYQILNLVTFYTFVGKKEVRAWALPRGSSLLEAARMIHTDIAEGFVKGEVININDFLRYSSEEKAKEHGAFRVEGKEYIVKDGDVVTIRFRM